MTAASLIFSEGEKEMFKCKLFVCLVPFIFSWCGCLVDVRCKKEILSKGSYINYVVANRGGLSKCLPYYIAGGGGRAK